MTHISTFYYDRQAQPIDIDTFARLHQTDEYKIIERTDFDRYTISTVWLGVNHNFDDGPPLIFETMIFSNDHLNNECDRYSTEEEARTGHERMVVRCQRAISHRFGDPDQVQS